MVLKNTIRWAHVWPRRRTNPAIHSQIRRMIELKGARRPAKPAVGRLFFADYHIKARRDILVLDIHDFPAVIASVYETTTQPTSEKTYHPAQ